MMPLFTYMVSRFACGGNFFGLPHWYKYINGGACGDIFIKPENFFSIAPLIGLAILDMLLRIAGVAAVAFIIYGAIKYITSQGSPDSTKAAQDTITNALVGLVLAIISVNVVAYIGHRLGGGG